MENANRTVQLAIRFTPDEHARIERFARMVQIATPAAVMRAAIRVGLDELERNPSRLFEQSAVGASATCAAELAEGQRCGEPAVAMDRARLVDVCAKHLAERPPPGQRVRRLPMKKKKGGG